MWWFSGRIEFPQGVFATIGWAEIGEWQILKNSAATEIEDPEVAPFLKGVFDDVELTAVAAAHLGDGDFASDELSNPDPAKSIQDHIAADGVPSHDQRWFVR